MRIDWAIERFFFLDWFDIFQEQTIRDTQKSFLRLQILNNQQ